MIKILVLIGLSCIFLSSSIHLYQDEPMVGGYSSIDIQNMSKVQKEIDQYLKSKFPGLKNAQLRSAEQQVVNGMNYKYRYQDVSNNYEWKIIVWNRSQQRIVTEFSKLYNTVDKDGNKIHIRKRVKAVSGGQTLEQAILDMAS